MPRLVAQSLTQDRTRHANPCGCSTGRWLGNAGFMSVCNERMTARDAARVFWNQARKKTVGTGHISSQRSDVRFRRKELVEVLERPACPLEGFMRYRTLPLLALGTPPKRTLLCTYTVTNVTPSALGSQQVPDHCESRATRSFEPFLPSTQPPSLSLLS